MGPINDVFSQNKLSLKKFGEILSFLINISKNKNQNNKILNEIGLINEYAQVISDKEPNEIIYCSKKYKIVQNIKFLIKMRENFLKWVKYFFDINNNDLDSIDKFNYKIEIIKNMNLTKEYFANNIKKYFKDKQFTKLFNNGIPPNLRLFIWEIIIAEKYSNNHTHYNYEEELALYRSLLKKNNSKPNPQIEKDLHRTIIKEKEQTPNNIQILKNILHCIDNYNDSGYCQGMNFVIGFLLKTANYNEVFAFYIFKHILNCIKGYFDEDLPLLKKNLNFFESNFIEMYPKIYKHFKKHEIINEFYITKWLQTIFTLTFPFEELCIIWDILLLKGFDFIIYICLAFFDFIEDDILKFKDSADILFYLEKSMNSEGENLMPINIRFFEQIDEYIIPLNEVLEKAQEIEKKIENKKPGIDYGFKPILNNKNIYKGRKSDGQILDFKFNSDKKTNGILNINNINNNIKNNNNIDNNLMLRKTFSDQDQSKFNSFNSNQNANTKLNNNNKNLIINNFQQQPNSLTFNKTIDERPNYSSTKNLGTFFFGDIRAEQNNKLNQNNFHPINNNINNYGFIQNNNNIPPNTINRVNYGSNLLFHKP